jgi:hypothetical protein
MLSGDCCGASAWIVYPIEHPVDREAVRESRKQRMRFSRCACVRGRRRKLLADLHDENRIGSFVLVVNNKGAVDPNPEVPL